MSTYDQNSARLLLQSATGAAAPLLALTRDRHAEFAKQQGYAYCMTAADDLGRSPNWQKIHLLRAAFESPAVEFAVWLDADAIIADVASDFSETVRNDDLAMWECRAQCHPRHFNSGVMIARNTARTRRFFDEVWEAGDTDHGWREQLRINEVAGRPEWNGFIRSLGEEWNSTWRVSEVPSPRVVAFHGGWGTPTKAGLMASFLIDGRWPLPASSHLFDLPTLFGSAHDFAGSADGRERIRKFGLPSNRADRPVQEGLNVTGARWQPLDGRAQEIAAGADGSLWCLGMDQLPTGGFSIHRWNGGGWDRCDGAALKITVDSNGRPSIVTAENRIFRRGVDCWQELPGLAQEIAAGPQDSLWRVGLPSSATGDGAIHVWNGTVWNDVGRSAAKIAVDREGQPWIVDSTGMISRRRSTGWERLPGVARDIACGGGGSVWCLSAVQRPTGGHTIHRWNGADWDHVPGTAIRITVGHGCVWVVTPENKICQKT